MKPTLLLAGFAALAAPAQARSDTDYPHRDWGKIATLDMTLAEATACISRELDIKGDVSVISAEGGNDIDFTVPVAWGKKHEPWKTFRVRSDNGVTSLRVFYRRPITQLRIDKDLRELEVRCLRVREISPSQ